MLRLRFRSARFVVILVADFEERQLAVALDRFSSSLRAAKFALIVSPVR